MAGMSVDIAPAARTQNDELLVAASASADAQKLLLFTSIPPG
jgi:hypothetical protein